MAAKLYSNFIKSIQQQIHEALQMKGLKFRTSEKQGKEIWQNCINNLPYVFNGTPVLRLLNQAAGLPALVIAPGPSLEEALPIIRQIQQQVLLITVDTAHRILHKHHIHSDLVVALDFTELNVKHFDSIENDPAHLVAFPGVNPQIPAKYEGRSFFYEHAGNVHYEPGATLLFRALKTLGPLGQIISYGSTAHAAYHLARLMGCTPIILVGNDLAFPNNKRYASGAMQEELKLTDEQSEMIEVIANDESKTYTRGIYKTYLFDFDPLIADTAGNVLNTSLQGAKIKHAPYQSLSEIANHLPAKPIDKSFIAKAAKPVLQQQKTLCLQEMNQLANLCLETREQLRPVAKQIRYLDPSDLNFKQTMLQSMKAFLSINQTHKGFPILDLASSLCSRSIISIMGQFGDVGLFGGDTPEKNQVAINRCNDLFKDLDQALEFIAKELKSAKEVLSE